MTVDFQKNTNMSSAIRYGLIGAGGIGRTHLEVLEKLREDGLIELIAIADPTIPPNDPGRMALEARGVRWYGDYRDMLDSAPVEAVSIATPIPLHFDMARTCAECGLFVLLEKPPVPLLWQLDELLSADENRRIGVCFQRIFSHTAQEAKSLISRGGLGKITDVRACGAWPRLDAYYARARWAGKLVLDGEPVFDGPATNAMAHIIHHMLYLASPEPGGFARPLEVRGELYRAREIESYDLAGVSGMLEGDTRFHAVLSHATQEEIPFQIDILGTDGFLRISDNGDSLETQEGCLKHPESIIEHMTKCYRQFLAFVRGADPKPSTSLEDTRAFLQVTNGMWVSSGGIHTIGPEWAKRHETGIAVEGLEEAMRMASKTGQTFYELSLPWAVPTTARTESASFAAKL